MAITGNIVPKGRIIGSINAGGSISGNMDKAVYPVYAGPYSITPSGNEQTLETEGKRLTRNVTIAAVESEAKAYAVSASGAQTINPSAGYSVMSQVDLSVPAGSVRMNKPSLNKESGELRSQANVNAGFVNQGGQYFGSVLTLDKQSAKTVTPSDTEQTAVEQYRWTTGDVKVAAIPSDYVGAAIERRDSSDLIATGNLVNVPAGYYAENAGKSIASGSVTASATKSISGNTATVTPRETRSAGYVEPGASDGTAVTVTASELVSGTLSVTANGTADCTNYAAVDVAVPASTPNLQAKTNIDPTTSSQTISADAGYDGLSSVQINAMPSGTEGTPTATKGTVSSHSISVTPSVTNSAGYISGGTKTGTAVTVSASELVSDTLTITGGGTYNVTNYASASVATGGATASATKGTVTNHSVDVTPKVTRTAGWVTAGSANGTAVTVTASELVSGSETKTANGTYDVTNLAELVVNVSGGGSTVKTKTGTFTGNGTRTIDVSCDFEPDLVYFTSDPGTTASSGTVAAIIVRGMMTATRYRNNSTTNSHYAIPDITDMNTGGTSYSWRATYANSKVTLYCFSSNARGLLTNNRTYTYTFMKWTS